MKAEILFESWGKNTEMESGRKDSGVDFLLKIEVYFMKCIGVCWYSPALGCLTVTC